MVDVVMRRQHGDARRLEAHLKVLRRRARQRAQIQERRPRRGDDDARGAGLQFGDALLAERPRDAKLIAIDCGDARVRAAVALAARRRRA